jgi:lipid-A-disaccharide synthase
MCPLSPDREAARAARALPRDAPVLAVLPGSRRGEIARLAETFLEAAARIATALPALRVVAPMASAAGRAVFEGALERSAIADRVTVLDGHSHEALVASDVVLVASGTATLEAMLAKRPMVVGYRLNALTHFIVKSFGLLKVSRYSLPNVLAGEDLVPELMQDRCTPEALAEAVLAYFRDGDRGEALRPRFESLHRSLARNASREAAEAIAELVGS